MQSIKVPEATQKTRYDRLQSYDHSHNEIFNSSSEEGFTFANEDPEFIPEVFTSGTHRIYWDQRDPHLNNEFINNSKHFYKIIRGSSSLYSYGCFFVSLLGGTMRTLWEMYSGEVPSVNTKSIWLDRPSIREVADSCFEQGFMDKNFYIKDKINVVLEIAKKLHEQGRIPEIDYEIKYEEFCNMDTVDTKFPKFFIYCFDTIWRKDNAPATGYHFAIGARDQKTILWDPENGRLGRGILGLTNRGRGGAISETEARKFRVFTFLCHLKD